DLAERKESIAGLAIAFPKLEDHQASLAKIDRRERTRVAPPKLLHRRNIAGGGRAPVLHARPFVRRIARKDRAAEGSQRPRRVQISAHRSLHARRPALIAPRGAGKSDRIRVVADSAGQCKSKVIIMNNFYLRRV